MTASNTDPKHWFKPVELSPGQWVIRNITTSQNLLGDYDTREQALQAIKKIAYQNPRFREPERRTHKGKQPKEMFNDSAEDQ